MDKLQGIADGCAADPEERFGTKLRLFGLPLLTDRWGIGVMIERMKNEPPTSEVVDTRRVLVEGKFDVPPAQEMTPAAMDFEDYYPGLSGAAIRAMRELESKRVPVGYLVFVNGKVQAWPKPEYNATPSDLYPTKMDGMSSGYEAVLRAERAAQPPTEREIVSALDHLFLAKLEAEPAEALGIVKSYAEACDRSTCDHSPTTEMIRRHVVPWTKARAENRTLALEVLGQACWVLGGDFK